MKFGRYLSSHRVPEWKAFYVDYRQLKKLIKRAAPVKTAGDGGSDHEGDESDQEVADSPDGFGNPRLSIDAASTAKQDVLEAEEISVPPTSAHSTTFLRRRTDSLRSNASSRLSRTSVGKRMRPEPTRRRTMSLRRSGQWRFPPSTPLERIMPLLNDDERKVFQIFQRELDKVDSFYVERENRTVERFRQIQEQLEELERHRKANELYKKTHDLYVPEAIRSAVPDAVADRIHRAISHIDPHPTAQPRAPTADQGQGPKNKLGEPQHPLADRMLQESGSWRPETYARARRVLKEAIFEEYRFLGMLKSYRALNRTGFSKALKKAEKVLKIPCSPQFMAKVNDSRFVASTGLDELTAKAENMFAEHFEGGSRKRALTRLRMLGVKKTHHASAGRAGTWIGLAIPALVDGIVKSYDADFRARTPEWPALMQLFGALLTPIVLACTMQINLTVWHRARINFPLIFEFDLRSMIDWHEYLELPAFLFCLLCYAFWLSMSNFWPDQRSPHVWPLTWVIVTLVILFQPLPIMHLHARYWLIRKTARLFTFGLIPVGFTDFWLGDQLTSLYYLFYNFGFLVCSYHRDFDDVPYHCNTNGTWMSPVLASIPAFMRLAQSIRRYVDSEGLPIHALNAGKYSATIIYFWLYFAWRIDGSQWNAYAIAFVVFASINSCYSAAWDLALDWNLLKWRSRYPLLRPELVFKDRIWVYPVAMVIDIILRFSWVIYLASAPSVTLRGWIVAIVETCRRAGWNAFRLESEQIGNMDSFRVTRDVPLPFSLSPKEEVSRTHEEPAESSLSSWALHPVVQLTRSFRAGELTVDDMRPKKPVQTLKRTINGGASESSDQDATETGSDRDVSGQEMV